ncbi:MAG: LysM peptidoglycan-binding domain-containing protein, partial [Candidatus Hydrogenedentes bacterium]|nr:LysM peptidoglycan-binding domain-containing protein [Candidatus Hydrogenedentota bacterium]
MLYPRNFQGGIDRSYRYLPFVRAELAKAGLPLDLVWLAMVESQFSPKVVSRAGAGGMWQFMRGTGSRYGLRIDRYVDERFNWRKSTVAAANYLRDLSVQFNNDWALAITAYNMGEGGLERVIAASGGETNLWRLLESSIGATRMQEESRKFYPKFVASILVANSPEKFGFMANVQSPEETIPVTVQGSYSLAALDKACGLPEGTLRAFNCDLIRGVTPPQGEFALAVPTDAGARLVTALHSMPKVRSESFASSTGRKTTHTVKRGETLSQIAEKYGVSLSSLAKANRLRSNNHLVQGKRLVIPGESAAPAEPDQVVEAAVADETAAPQTEPAARARLANAVYTVKKGDTLYEIAQHNKVSIKDLLAWNKKKNARITAGEKLVVSPLDKMVEDARQEEAEQLTHIVKPGESPAKIAAQYGVSVDDFLAWNKLSKASTIRIGQRLVVKGYSSPDEPPAPDKIQLAKLETDIPDTTTKQTAKTDPKVETEQPAAEK